MNTAQDYPEKSTRREQTERLLQSAVEAARDAHPGDIKAQTNHLERAARSDSELWRQVTKHLLRQGCYDAVRQAVRSERGRVWTAPNYSTADGATRARALAQSNLMSFPLPTGQKLGDATREEVAEAAQFYQRQASDMAHKSRWLSRIVDELPEGQAVSEALNETQLEQMRSETLAQ